MAGSSLGLVMRWSREAGEWAQELSRFEIDLFRNGAPIDHGRAANVLDGPLFALRHLVETLAEDQESPSLAAGEIVTTGTLTRAFPSPRARNGPLSSREFRSRPRRFRFV